MSTETDGANGEGMAKIDVRVPVALLEQIDEEYSRRGYTSRSEAIRDALRDWLNPSVTLSEEALDDLEESREQIECSETVSADEARERLGLMTDAEYTEKALDHLGTLDPQAADRVMNKIDEATEWTEH